MVHREKRFFRRKWSKTGDRGTENTIGIHQRTKLFNPPIIRMRPGHAVSKTGAARFATISRRIMAFKNKGARHWSKITAAGGK